MILGTVKGSYRLSNTEPLTYFEDNITEEDIMGAHDKLEGLVGDGEAKVIVSKSLSDSDYGTGFSARVVVELSCSQEQDVIDETFQIADKLTDGYVQAAFSSALEQFNDREKRRGKKR